MPGLYRQREREAQRAVDKLRRMDVAWTKEEWSPEMGNCLWWSFPIQELPYVGRPDDDAFPDHCTHFTPLVVPSRGLEPIRVECFELRTAAGHGTCVAAR